MTTKLRVSAVVTALIVAASVPAGGSPSGAAAADDHGLDPALECDGHSEGSTLIGECEDEHENEQPGGDDDGGGNGGGGPGAPPVDGIHCRWSSDLTGIAPEWVADRFPEIPEGWVVQAYQCGYFKDGSIVPHDQLVEVAGIDVVHQLGGALFGTVGWRFSGEVRMVPESEADEGVPPSPEVIAEMLLARIEVDLVVPEVVADPPCSGPDDGGPLVCEPTIVGLPTFVAVTNWPEGGEIREGGCDLSGTVCIEIVAVPSLRFYPGEDGARFEEDGEATDYVACTGGGTRYDPDRTDPRAQAAEPGACTYTYTLRTGPSGRPSEGWPGRVEIAWTASWAGSGMSGDFGEIPSTATEMLRPVDELQSVVRDSSPERTPGDNR